MILTFLKLMKMLNMFSKIVIEKDEEYIKFEVAVCKSDL